jgi:hypothetical protein
MAAVVVVAAYFLPAHEPVRVHEGEAFQQCLHIHQGKPSHHPGSLNRTEPVFRIRIGSGFQSGSGTISKHEKVGPQTGKKL